jgi:hypothetical protein
MPTLPEMNTSPPPRPAWKKKGIPIVWIVVGVLSPVVIGLLILGVVRMSGITKVPDNMFGDQHLKTSVALIELHKVRFGKYPDSLSDLKFTGKWDQIALESVRYYPNAMRTAYYIEVERGWVGKPDLKMPDEFWRGTGYDIRLRAENP